MLNDLYRSVVMDHAKYKRNYGRLEGRNTKSIYYKNPSCGDIITLYIQFEQERIHDVAFEGAGCSISMASSSMMTELIKGKQLFEVNILKNEFEALIKEGIRKDETIELGDAKSLEGVHKLRARHNCALMSWQALERILSD